MITRDLDAHSFTFPGPDLKMLVRAILMDHDLDSLPAIRTLAMVCVRADFKFQSTSEEPLQRLLIRLKT